MWQYYLKFHSTFFARDEHEGDFISLCIVLYKSKPKRSHLTLEGRAHRAVPPCRDEEAIISCSVPSIDPHGLALSCAAIDRKMLLFADHERVHACAAWEICQGLSATVV